MMRTQTALGPESETERQLREALAERDRLLLEAHHRTKNHFQIIASIVKLEAKGRGAECAEFAEEVARRVGVLASLHESLYRSNGTGGVDAGDYLRRVAEPLGSDLNPVTVVTESGLLLTGEQASPVGMIVNEAICNALKHAYPNGRPGPVLVTARTLPGGMVKVTVADRGDGVRKEPGTGSLGLRLVRQLAGQLGGSYSLTDAPEGGAALTLTFPA